MLTLAQAAEAIRRYAYVRREIVLSVMTSRLQWARDRAVNFYMLPQAGPETAPSPDKLTHRSGALGRGTRVNPPRQVGDKTVGGIISTEPYSAIHEFGGQTRAHVIRPLRGHFLAWQGPGGPVFAREVHHPGSRIPARPRLRPALEDALPLLSDDLRAEFAKAQAALGLG